METQLERKARNTLEKYGMLDGVRHVVVGLSGGADSVSLLHFLAGLRGEAGFSLSALHLNHLLRGEEALRDENYAKELCAALEVPISVHRLPISELAKARGVSFETAGRDERYRLFEAEAAKYGGVVATAHTASDAAETLLLNLMRGSGLAGLGAIPPRRGIYIRPLIDCLREEVEDYCAAHGLAFVTDSTNLSPDYARNRVRLELLPYMKEHFNPAITETLARTAELLREDEAALDALVPDTGDVEALQALPFALRSRALRRMAGRALSFEQTKALDALILSGQNGVVRSLPDGLEARAEYGRLRVEKGGPAAIAPQTLRLGNNQIDGFGNIKLSIEDEKSSENIYNHRLKCGIIQNTLCVRARTSGDKYRPCGRPEKSLARLAKDAKLPASLRGFLPVIEADGKIVAAFPFGPSQEAAAGEEPGLLITYYPKEHIEL
ncbi:MAG TPA: tRNA lysidine(34) synthetase TilS [Terriglobales bacterium]|nr:tRNA lysidine(34) synthetase TilS [Terriglobales bacterium]